MKFLSVSLIRQIRERQKTRLENLDTKQEALIKQGREQFKKLIEKGLSIPVVLL